MPCKPGLVAPTLLRFLFFFMTARTGLRHLFFRTPHITVTSKALLVISAQQGGRTAGRRVLRGMAGAAGGHALLRFQWSQMVATGADRGLLAVEESRQLAVVGDVSQLLRNILVLDCC